MSKRVKYLAIAALALAAIIPASTFLTGSKNKPTPQQTKKSPIVSDTSTIPLPVSSGTQKQSNDEFSTLLSNISRISIDTSLFENRAYRMLRDFPISLGSDIVGRINPFAPVGTDLSTGDMPLDLSIQTLQAGKVTKSSAEFGAQLSVSDKNPTSIVFEYGISDTFGNATDPLTVTKSGTTLITVQGLDPETTYYVRAVAVHGSTTATGNITSFTTKR